MKISEHFDIRELVHPDIWNHPAIGERCIDWIHPNVKYTLEDLREALGPIVINDWMYGGRYVDSGLRLPFELPSKEEVQKIMTGSGSFESMYGALVKAFQGVGARFSGHKFGGTFDLKFKNNAEAYYHILNNQDKYPFILRVESFDHTGTWIHVEIGNRRKGDINVFAP